MEKDASLIGKSPVTKKKWQNGPQLTILARDPIQGGTNTQYREGTGTLNGQPKITNNTGPGVIYEAVPGDFNHWLS